MHTKTRVIKPSGSSCRYLLYERCQSEISSKNALNFHFHTRQSFRFYYNSSQS